MSSQDFFIVSTFKKILFLLLREFPRRFRNHFLEINYLQLAGNRPNFSHFRLYSFNNKDQEVRVDLVRVPTVFTRASFITICLAKLVQYYDIL